MKKLAFVSAVAWSLLFGAGVASAQNNTYSYTSDPMNPCVADIAASMNNSNNVYALGCDIGADKRIYKRTSSGWTQFAAGSTAAQVEVSNSGVPWIRKAAGSIYRWDLTLLDWVRVGTTSNCASDFGVGVDAWELGCNGTTKRVYKWNGTTWTEPQPDARGSHIAVGADNAAWLQVADGGTGSGWRWNGSSFVFIDSCISVVGGNGWVVGCDGDDIWQWINNGWTRGGDPFGSTITMLTADGTFAALPVGSTYIQSKFESFQMNGIDDIGYHVVGKYFPGGATLYWEYSKTGELFYLRPVSANTIGFIDQTQAFGGGFSCFFFKQYGLKRSDPAQRMWLGNGDRWASLTSSEIQRHCATTLDP